MSDVVFRTKTDVSTKIPVVEKAPDDKGVPRGVTNVEPPFSDYEAQEGHPFLVDHYELGRYWDTTDMYSDGFTTEVKDVNRYLKHAIDKGDINNTTDSVKRELKRIEKMVNVKPDSRKSVRLGLVAEYTKFLLKSENIKKESAEYGFI